MNKDSKREGCGVGIDTGGTYTDAVLIDLATQKVLGAAKELTTHYDLGVGISRALKELMTNGAVDPGDVKSISVSTTLATNSVVEGKGARVGLFIIGFTKPFDLPVVSVKYIEGGHDFTGKEEKSLDVEALLDGVLDFKDQVEAYAVSSAMSIVNPSHELVAAKAIGLADPKPVFCSHRISDRAGVRERAATAVLNARLMPVMRDFIDGVRQTLRNLSLRGDVIIIRGDATPMPIDNAIERAAATVASGPAATAFFGSAFSPARDALVVDVGGTTTDITMIRGGRPIIDANGSLIGDWRTHVNAVEMFTAGIGGDSHVEMSNKGSIQVGPARVTPLAMAGDVPPPGRWLGSGPKSRCLTLAPGLAPDLARKNPVLRFLMENGPSTPAAIQKGLDLAGITLADRLKELVHAQVVSEIGFTPTDALCALGLLEIGSKAPALEGAEALAVEADLAPGDLCKNVLAAAERKIEEILLSHVTRKEIGESMAGFLPGLRNNAVLDVTFSLNIPIVGIGAAARHLLPGVAKKLGAEVVFPDHFEVGNALGAILMAARIKPQTS